MRNRDALFRGSLPAVLAVNSRPSYDSETSRRVGLECVCVFGHGANTSQCSHDHRGWRERQSEHGPNGRFEQPRRTYLLKFERTRANYSSGGSSANRLPDWRFTILAIAWTARLASFASTSVPRAFPWTPRAISDVGLPGARKWACEFRRRARSRYVRHSNSDSTRCFRH